jgi:hypothetical protein
MDADGAALPVFTHEEFMHHWISKKQQHDAKEVLLSMSIPSLYKDPKFNPFYKGGSLYGVGEAGRKVEERDNARVADARIKAMCDDEKVPGFMDKIKSSLNSTSVKYPYGEIDYKYAGVRATESFINKYKDEVFYNFLVDANGYVVPKKHLRVMFKKNWIDSDEYDYMERALQDLEVVHPGVAYTRKWSDFKNVDQYCEYIIGTHRERISLWRETGHRNFCSKVSFLAWELTGNSDWSKFVANNTNQMASLLSSKFEMITWNLDNLRIYKWHLILGK